MRVLGTTASGVVDITIPTAPQSFTATAASSTSINLSWAAPASNGGAAITGYTLKNGATTVYTGTGTSITQTGLTPGTAYSYTVLATNSVGNGPTASASATTLAGVPSATTISSTQTVNQGYFYNEDDSTYYASVYQISIPLSNSNGSVITGTEIQLSGDGVTAWTTIYNGSTVTSYEFYAYQYGPYGYIRAFHKNAVGNAPVSNSVSCFF
jgi:chitodextrinase